MWCSIAVNFIKLVTFKIIFCLKNIEYNAKKCLIFIIVLYEIHLPPSGRRMRVKKMILRKQLMFAFLLSMQ